DVNAVGSCLRRHAHIVVDASGAELQLNWNLPVRRLADFLNLEREIVGTEPVGMPRGRALIDAGGQRTHFGDLIGDLLAHQVPAEADLATLPDEELAAI